MAAALIKAPTATHRVSGSHQGFPLVLITGSVKSTPGMAKGSTTNFGWLSVFFDCDIWIDSDTKKRAVTTET